MKEIFENSINLPCKVGDMVLIESECLNIIDDDTATECPFEKDCQHEDCDIYYKRKFISKIRVIYNEGNGWKFKLNHLKCEISIEDLGKTAFLVKNYNQE